MLTIGTTRRLGSTSCPHAKLTPRRALRGFCFVNHHLLTRVVVRSCASGTRGHIAAVSLSANQRPLPNKPCNAADRHSYDKDGLRSRFGRGIFPAAGSLPAVRRKS